MAAIGAQPAGAAMCCQGCRTPFDFDPARGRACLADDPRVPRAAGRYRVELPDAAVRLGDLSARRKGRSRDLTTRRATRCYHPHELYWRRSHARSSVPALKSIAVP